jgi:hypothetical protein
MFPSLMASGNDLALFQLEELFKINCVNNSTHLISHSDEVKRISEIIECPIDIVHYCMLQIGPSLPAIDAFWQMNKDRLLREFDGSESKAALSALH